MIADTKARHTEQGLVVGGTEPRPDGAGHDREGVGKARCGEDVARPSGTGHELIGKQMAAARDVDPSGECKIGGGERDGLLGQSRKDAIAESAAQRVHIVFARELRAAEDRFDAASAHRGDTAFRQRHPPRAADLRQTAGGPGFVACAKANLAERCRQAAVLNDLPGLDSQDPGGRHGRRRRLVKCAEDDRPRARH